MTNPAQLKRDVKEIVLKALARDGLADLETLSASLRLETGFKKKVIDEILADMVKVDLITIENGVIKRPVQNA